MFNLVCINESSKTDDLSDSYVFNLLVSYITEGCFNFQNHKCRTCPFKVRKVRGGERGVK